jgi:hypothetical protein
MSGTETALGKIKTGIEAPTSSKEGRNMSHQSVFEIEVTELGPTDARKNHGPFRLKFAPRRGDFLELPYEKEGSWPMKILAVVHDCNSQYDEEKGAKVEVIVRPVDSMDELYQSSF